MKKSEKQAIYQWAAGLSDKQLEQEYYDSVYSGACASCGEEMYDRGFAIEDCVAEDERAKYEREKDDIIESLCYKRGIKLWDFEEVENSGNKEGIV